MLHGRWPKSISIFLPIPSKHLTEFISQDFDYVITVCDNAKEACPYFPGGKKIIHYSFPDPSALRGMDEEIVIGVRSIRDEIKKWILDVFRKKWD